MSLLEHPAAQAILADATVTPEQVHACQDRITTFLQRYLPRFYRAEQRAHATLVIRGLLSGLQRKTCEPIGVEAGAHREPVQNFVGAGGRDDQAVMAELRGQASRWYPGRGSGIGRGTKGKGCVGTPWAPPTSRPPTRRHDSH